MRNGSQIKRRFISSLSDERSKIARFCLAAIVLFVAVVFVTNPVAAATLEVHDDRVVTEGVTAWSPATENETTPNATTAPENATYTVMVYPTADRIVVKIRYQSRSKTEAAKAENGTLNVSWFDADERLREAFAAREESDQLVQSSNLTIGVGEESMEYRDIGIKVEFEWHGVFEPGEEREVIGPHIAEAFRPGDQLVVRVFEWQPEYANAEREPTAYPRNMRYDWRIGEGDEPPRIAFNRSVLEDDDSNNPRSVEVPLGPVAGVLSTGIALIALLLAVALASKRRDDEDGFRE